MSLPESQLERLESTVSVDVEDPERVLGKSPTQLALGRFRRDKLSMLSFFVVATYVIGGLLAPVLVKAGVIDPLKLNQNLLDPSLGSIPKAKWGGISWAQVSAIHAFTPAGWKPSVCRTGMRLLPRCDAVSTWSSVRMV